MFTQPLMYKKIGTTNQSNKSTRTTCCMRVFITSEGAQKVIDDRIAYLDEEFDAGTSYISNKADWLEGKWAGMVSAHGEDRRGDTAVSLELLSRIGKTMTTPPENLQLNSKLLRILKGAG